MSRYLVTGAYGAIGVWTIRSLLDREHEVVSFDVGEQAPRLALALAPEEAERITRVRGDIADLNAVEQALDEHGITHVIHLAALQVPFVRADPPLGARVDVLGTVNVFEAVRSAARAGSRRSSTPPRSPRSATTTTRARSTASSSGPTRAPASATSRTTASRRSACGRTPSTARAATRA